MDRYQICSRCVMDTTHSTISFLADGTCSNCNDFINNVIPKWEIDLKDQHKFKELVKNIAKKGKNKKYDCVIGLSGGLDSSYLLHKAVRDFGLKPLVFHVDGGWNTDLAVENIQNLVNGLDLELFTYVVNWKEMRDLQLSFFKSGLPHIDLPQDLAFISALYNYAEDHKISYILNGGNYSTEGIRNPKNWGWYGTDLKHVRDVHSKFGSIELKTFPMSGILNHKLYLHYLKGIKIVKPLNYIEYNKSIAIDTLSRLYGWRAYPQKHFESRFTRFFEGYWLPNRFGYDTRKVQYSSLIVTGQMSRDEALSLLNSPALDNETVEKDKTYISSKLRISIEELESYFHLPKKTYRDYKNQKLLFDLGQGFLETFGIEKNTKK